MKPRLVNANNLQKVKAHAAAAHASASAAAATVAARLHGHITASPAVAATASRSPQQPQPAHQPPCTAATFTPSDLHEQCLASFNETVDRLRNTPQLAKLVQSAGVEKLLQSLEQSAIPRSWTPVREHSSQKQRQPWKIDYKSAHTFRENRGECGGLNCAVQLQPTALLGSLVGACSTIG